MVSLTMVLGTLWGIGILIHTALMLYRWRRPSKRLEALSEITPSLWMAPMGGYLASVLVMNYELAVVNSILGGLFVGMGIVQGFEKTEAFFRRRRRGEFDLPEREPASPLLPPAPPPVIDSTSSVPAPAAKPPPGDDSEDDVIFIK